MPPYPELASVVKLWLTPLTSNGSETRHIGEHKTSRRFEAKNASSNKYLFELRSRQQKISIQKSELKFKEFKFQFRNLN